jgi:hypothetical protein
MPGKEKGKLSLMDFVTQSKNQSKINQSINQPIKA